MTDEEEEWVKAVFMLGRLTVRDLLRNYGKLDKCQQEGRSCVVRHNGDWKNLEDPTPTTLRTRKARPSVFRRLRRQNGRHDCKLPASPLMT